MENQHTIDTANEKIVLPSFDGLTPKEMRRAWAKFVADREWTPGAEWVTLSIEELILNMGRDAEPTSRRNLEQRLATFSASLR